MRNPNLRFALSIRNVAHYQTLLFLGLGWYDKGHYTNIHACIHTHTHYNTVTYSKPLHVFMFLRRRIP